MPVRADFIAASIAHREAFSAGLADLTAAITESREACDIPHSGNQNKNIRNLYFVRIGFVFINPGIDNRYQEKV